MAILKVEMFFDAADNSLSQLLLMSPPGPHGLHLQLSPGSSTQGSATRVPSFAGSVASRDSLSRAPPPPSSAPAPPPPKLDVTRDQKLAGGLAPTRAGIMLGATAEGFSFTKAPVMTTVSEPRNLPVSATGGQSNSIKAPVMTVSEHGSLDDSALGRESNADITGSDSSKTLHSSSPPPATTNATLLMMKSPIHTNGTSSDLLRLSASQNTLGSSLGLPSELLGSLSSSSYFGSESEGDTVQSALASALEMHGVARLSNGGGSMLPDASTEAIFSLSQSARSLPRDPEPSLSLNHLLMPPTTTTTTGRARQQVSLSPASESLEVLFHTLIARQFSGSLVNQKDRLQ